MFRLCNEDGTKILECCFISPYRVVSIENRVRNIYDYFTGFTGLRKEFKDSIRKEFKDICDGNYLKVILVAL